MIDGLISGKIFGTPAQRTGASGKQFTVCKVRTPVSAEESIFVSVICFDADAGRVLAAMGDGDSVALAGTLAPKVWTDKAGTPKPALDLVAHQVLTAYHVTRKRKAVHESRPASNQPKDAAWRARAPQDDWMDGDLNI